MAHPISIYHHPLFERMTVEKHPALFDRFVKHVPDSLKKKYQKVRETFHQYEETITWPLIIGPGFCGATNPGAENILNTIMVSSNSHIYNSDCLYINPSQKVFAISDGPGMTTCSRDLLEKMDHYINDSSVDDIERIINDIDRETGTACKATLSLIYFSGNGTDKVIDKASVYIAGDTHIFYGNILKESLTPIEGSPSFIGRQSTYLKPTKINLKKGDFFIIASDGISDIRLNYENLGLEEAIWNEIKKDPENFTFNIIKNSNGILEERVNNRVTTRFGGSDNISTLLIYPENLSEIYSKQNYILGGYIGHG